MRWIEVPTRHNTNYEPVAGHPFDRGRDGCGSRAFRNDVAGVRAVGHLQHVMIEAEALPVRTQTLIPFVTAAFDASGQPTSPALEIGLGVMLEDLAWLGDALQVARAGGAPQPPTLRIRNALAGLQKKGTKP
jgi:hypothetical protein